MWWKNFFLLQEILTTKLIYNCGSKQWTWCHYYACTWRRTRWEGTETWFSGTHHTPVSYLKGDYGGGILRAWGWASAWPAPWIFNPHRYGNAYYQEAKKLQECTLIISDSRVLCWNRAWYRQSTEASNCGSSLTCHTPFLFLSFFFFSGRYIYSRILASEMGRAQQ